jgi:poly(3-hydroxybutyrate) depolymerase
MTTLPWHVRSLAVLLVSGLCTLAAAEPIADLTTFLDTQPPAAREPPDAAWTRESLSKDQARHAADLIVKTVEKRLKAELQPEWDAKTIRVGKASMKFDFREFGAAPPSGRSLYISMHGGGSTTKEINDGQWKNQIRLYQPSEGLYLAPRAPTDAWNMWHQSDIDALFDRLIAAAVVCAGVDPNRVYLMGYSAGGDGVYQLAPRMADRFAAAAMMAGHPNDARPDGLRNLPFAIHMGANDGAFNRNGVAREWGQKLDALRAADPQGYPHTVTLHEGKGHWMDRQDAVAVSWMATYTRPTAPDRVVWVQSSTTHRRMYWLGVDQPVAGSRLDVSHSKNVMTIDPSSTVSEFVLLLNDDIADLDRNITIHYADFTQVISPSRSIEAIWSALAERFDPGFVPTSRISVRLPRQESPVARPPTTTK